MGESKFDKILMDSVLCQMGLKHSNAQMSIAKVKGRGGIGKVWQAGGMRQPTWIWEEIVLYPDALSWFDHTEIYWHRGEKSHAIITHPYDLDNKKFESLQSLCDAHGLHCHRSMHDSWWYPGWTELVIVHPGIQDVFDYMIKSRAEATK